MFGIHLHVVYSVELSQMKDLKLFSIGFLSIRNEICKNEICEVNDMKWENE